MTYSTHLHSASETSGDPESALLASIPYGRVGAEIVCDDTLVQYAAYCALVLLSGGESGIIRFRSFWWGWRFTFFFPLVSILILPPLHLCAGSGSGKDCLATLLISGVAGHVPVRFALRGSLTLHGVWVWILEVGMGV